jgi:vancomycin permeability regulator SanA
LGILVSHLFLPAFAAAAIAGSTVAVTCWRIKRASRSGLPTPGSAIVVFGAEAINGRPSAELEARLRFAATLYRDGRAPLILCSGGHSGPHSEPRAMRRALVRWGVAESDIQIDEQGSSTRRSIAAATRMPAGQRRRVLLVSSPYHMYRICREARRQGLVGVGCPAPTTPVMRHGGARRRQVLREVAAIWWYAMVAATPSPLLLRRRNSAHAAKGVRPSTEA